MLTHGIPPDFRGGVHIIHLNRYYTLSGQSRVYRVTQLRTNGVHCRESAGTGPVNPKVVHTGGCLCITIDQSTACASLSHTHYWYEVGMLKVLYRRYKYRIVLCNLYSSCCYCPLKNRTQCYFTLLQQQKHTRFP